MKLEPIKSGIFELMDDLGKGLASGDNFLLGGGNPAHTDVTFDFFSETLAKIGADRKLFADAIQSYTEPQGYFPLREQLANYFKKKFNWSVSAKNICLTNGMQNGFYLLLNYFIKNYHPQSGRNNQIFLAKLPDYIGYFDTVDESSFTGSMANQVMVGENQFRYEINYQEIKEKLEADRHLDAKEEIAALLISSPNNPSSSVLSKKEIDQIIAWGKEYEKYLIFDHAYGKPFPNMIYGETEMPPFTENTIHCFSFSKLGLPGIRLGFILAEESLIDKISVSSGIQTLSPSSFNAVFINEIFKNKNIDDYVENQLKPFYLKRKEMAVTTLLPYLKNTQAKIHQVEGGFFVWLNLSGINKTSKAIYNELKDAGVIVVPGEYFYPSQPSEPFLRISFTTSEKELLAGLKLVGEWVQKNY